MTKPYRIQVFGKAGCDKCTVLNQRLDKLLEKPEWQTFEKQYCDMLSEEGLIEFSEAECINPQRIPAMLVQRWDEAAQAYKPVSTREPGAADPVCGTARLYHFVGLQTDYGPVGKGVLSPRMLTHVLQEALA